MLSFWQMVLIIVQVGYSQYSTMLLSLNTYLYAQKGDNNLMQQIVYSTANQSGRHRIYCEVTQ